MSENILPLAIDLLSTPNGEPLVLVDGDLPYPPMAVLFDHATREVGFEFQSGMGYVACNIPVDDDHLTLLKTQGRIYVTGLAQGNKISTINVLQLYHQNFNEDDIYVPPFTGTASGITETQGVLAGAKRAQALNRSELAGSVGTLGGVLKTRGIESGKALALSSRLQHELQQELEYRRQMAPNFQPRMAPPGLGPKSTGAHLNTLNMQTYAPKPPTFPNGETDSAG